MQKNAATRFWEAQGDAVGTDPNERVRFMYSAAKRLIEADGTIERLRRCAIDPRERIGLARVVGFLAPSSREAFEAVAYSLASGANQDYLFIGIPRNQCHLYDLYDPRALVHLFAATIGMLAPQMHVHIITRGNTHETLLYTLRTHRYVKIKKKLLNVRLTLLSISIIDRFPRISSS